MRGARKPSFKIAGIARRAPSAHTSAAFIHGRHHRLTELCTLGLAAWVIGVASAMLGGQPRGNVSTSQASAPRKQIASSQAAVVSIGEYVLVLLLAT